MFFLSYSPDADAGPSVVNWQGLLGVIAFYILILGMGIFASWKSKAFKSDTSSEDVMIARRKIGIVVGMFTMTGMQQLLKACSTYTFIYNLCAFYRDQCVKLIVILKQNHLTSDIY